VAFWDASALVPLCVHQPLTSAARNRYREFEIVVWWATPVEIASALARLARMRQINGKELNAARTLMKNLAGEWWVVQPLDALRSMATSLIERHDLRAADALQLAAALEWCENRSQGRIFFTADERLRQAALLSGFESPKL
jgi:predicted nucleic acid-binding protein